MVILYYLIAKCRADGQFDNFFTSPKRWEWIFAGVLACLGANLISFYRWRVMVRAIELPFSIWDAVRIGFIGLFFNLSFGVVAGDTFRSFYVARQIPDKVTEAISSVLADRVIGMLTMFGIASTAFLVFDVESLSSDSPKDLELIKIVCQGVLGLTCAGLCGLTAIFLAPWLTQTSWYRQLMKLPKLGGILEKLTDVVLQYRKLPLTLLAAVLLSVGVNVCFLLAIYCLAIGIASDIPTFPNHFVIEPIAMVANAVPIPGGIGGMEFAMDFLYRGFGSPSGLLVAFAFRCALLLVSAAGAVVWFANRAQLKNIADTASENTPNSGME